MVTNTQIIQITGTNSGLLSTFPTVSYYDGFFFQNIDFSSTYTYPTTTYGGPLTGDAGYIPYENDGVAFNFEISGGPIENYTYEDFSKLTSFVDIGNFFCLPTITFAFSSYDESVSPINKISYYFNELQGVLSPSISTRLVTFFITPTSSPTLIEINSLQPPKQKTFSITPTPTESYQTNYTLFLSVFKMDNTVNKFICNLNLFQCGILDVYNSTNIIDSQILDDPRKILLTMEDRDNNQVFNSILKTDIPFYLLTGGDIIELKTEEIEPQIVFELETTPVPEVFLAEQIRQQNIPVVPIPEPKINPVVPVIAKYFYRGERGIRIRPPIVSLLPGQEFFYQQPQSGLIILSGGAPYIPGNGINFNVEFRGLQTPN
jgi:hypothetical protein